MRTVRRIATLATLFCNASGTVALAQTIPTQTAPTAAIASPPATASSAASTPAAPVVHLSLGDVDPSRLMAEQVAAMVRQMTDPAGDQDARDLAARRLLTTVGTNDARTALLNALKDLNNPGGRLAAARAVADDAPPGPEFVDPLFVLIDTEASPPLMDAGATALANYKSIPEVSVRLAELTDARRTMPVRIAAVHALAGQIEKRAAAKLVQLTQEAAIAPAAIAALQSFTQLDFDSAADWATWWRSQADAPDDRFRIETLTARVNHADHTIRHDDETYQELNSSILATMNAAPRDQQVEVFTRYLRSPREKVRLIAIRRTYLLTAELPAALRPVVRELLSDVSADVRFEAARLVQAINDADAFAYVVQQASVEPDARVRAKLADALGTIGNLDGLPLLRSMLDDPSTLVVQSTAAALAQMGPAIASGRPREAQELAIELRVLADQSSAGNGAQRDALLAALVPLKQKSMLPTFAAMLTQQPPAPTSTRILAIQGMGAIGSPEIESLLVDALADPQPLVRLAVVNAIKQVSQDFNNAPRLYALLDPTAESDARVRNAAWEVIRSQLPLPTTPLEQIARWPGKPLIEADQTKLLAIYDVLAQRYGQDPARAGDQTDALQHVGECHMQLGKAAETADNRDAAAAQFTEAAKAYSTALSIARQTGPAMRVQSLVVDETSALLRARDYTGAVAFARGLPRDYQEALSTVWKLEAERLDGRKTADDDASALDLITAANQMGDVLPTYYLAQLAEIRSGIEKRQNEKNQYAIPDWMRAVCIAD